MPGPLLSALAPSLASSAAGGATGAFMGQAAGEDRDLHNQLIEAQIGWQKAHAAGYGHMQKTSAAAMAQLQAALAQDPNFLRTDAGRFLAYTAGKFDPFTQDALAAARTQQGYASEQHGNLFGQQGQTEQALRDPRIYAQTELGSQREAIGDQYRALTPGKVAEGESRTGLNQARILSEGALQGLRGWQAQLAKSRSELAQQAKKSGGHALNLYSMADMYHQRVQDALKAQEDGTGPGPDLNDLAILDDLRTKLRGPEYGALPLGSPGVYDRSTGIIPQPEVPEKRSWLGFGAPVPGTGTPATPPAKQPLNLTPRAPSAAAPATPAAPARPGGAEREQSILKARKLIHERGAKFASDQLKTNKALTPTEKSALQEALLLEAGQP
jgi:hypothetical protein